MIDLVPYLELRLLGRTSQIPRDGNSAVLYQRQYDCSLIRSSCVNEDLCPVEWVCGARWKPHYLWLDHRGEKVKVNAIAEHSVCWHLF